MINETIRNIYSLLLNRQYEQIQTLTNGIRLNAQEIEESISSYGRNLKQYPEHVKFDVIEITGHDPKAWSVVAPVYTVEEDLSDLSIEMTLIQKSTDSMTVELDGIHVR